MNDDLEAMDGLCAKIIEQRDRVEALEALLREGAFMMTMPERTHWRERARAALAPEQDK